MERIRKVFSQSAPAYEPLGGGSVDADGERIEHHKEDGFSWLDYSIFLLLGVAMLWAWYDLCRNPIQAIPSVVQDHTESCSCL
jgi:hypothetical protein